MKHFECYCGTRIHAVGSMWLDDLGRDRCYADDPTMEDSDREAQHEPFADWEEEVTP